MPLLKASSLVFIGIMIGCLSSCEAARAGFFPTIQEKANSITYVKDSRTGLCFVYNTVLTNVNSVIMTNVPCTPEVERLLVK